jgi:hypothetical protein
LQSPQHHRCSTLRAAYSAATRRNLPVTTPPDRWATLGQDLTVDALIASATKPVDPDSAEQKLRRTTRATVLAAIGAVIESDIPTVEMAVQAVLDDDAPDSPSITLAIGNLTALVLAEPPVKTRTMGRPATPYVDFQMTGGMDLARGGEHMSVVIRLLTALAEGAPEAGSMIRKLRALRDQDEPAEFGCGPEIAGQVLHILVAAVAFLVDTHPHHALLRECVVDARNQWRAARRLGEERDETLVIDSIPGHAGEIVVRAQEFGDDDEVLDHHGR